MGELKKSAAVFIARDIAAHQLRRQLPHRRHENARLEERALQVLEAEIDDRCEVGRTAHATGLQVAWMHIGFLRPPPGDRSPRLIGSGRKSAASGRERSTPSPPIGTLRTGYDAPARRPPFAWKSA